jgi:hypothetical protein
MHEGIKHRLIEALIGKPLVSNAFRGSLVEAIIAEAIEPKWRWCADGWGSFDFEGPNGIGLEIKQSAARQNWHTDTCKPCVPRFDIAERTGYWTDTSKWVDRPGRAAAIYIFAWHPLFDAAVADHREPEQWEFYVVPASALPSQKSIGLGMVRTLAKSVCFAALLAAVTECHSTVTEREQKAVTE